MSAQQRIAPAPVSVCRMCGQFYRAPVLFIHQAEIDPGTCSTGCSQHLRRGGSAYPEADYRVLTDYAASHRFQFVRGSGRPPTVHAGWSPRLCTQSYGTAD